MEGMIGLAEAIEALRFLADAWTGSSQPTCSSMQVQTE